MSLVVWEACWTIDVCHVSLYLVIIRTVLFRRLDVTPGSPAGYRPDDESDEEARAAFFTPVYKRK